jgi:hypothetical protein
VEGYQDRCFLGKKRLSFRDYENILDDRGVFYFQG